MFQGIKRIKRTVPGFASYFYLDGVVATKLIDLLIDKGHVTMILVSIRNSGRNISTNEWNRKGKTT